MLSFLHTYIVLFSLSSTVAVQLYGSCTNTAQCEGSNVICTSNKCLCNTPSYLPCKSTCELNRFSAYEGDPCEVSENCPDNANCVSKKCACLPGFTTINGLCLKNLNATCAKDSECRSQFCSNSRCTCLPGYQPSGNNTSCQRRLVKIYRNWSDANNAKEFCIDENSCTDVIATCVSGPQNTAGKFCKCPNGYRLQNNEKCELIVSSLLSPLDQDVTNYAECGGCQDQNAACIKAADETTCWCRSSYEKRNNKCQKQSKTSLIIFPNEDDLSSHDFTSNCNNASDESIQVENQRCACAPGYQLTASGRSCMKIQRNWINRISEYGVCTRITSGDESIDVDGLCPKPLTCEARKDKHVCTCGRNKFIDPTDPSRCVYFIGATTNSSTDVCSPVNSIRNSTTGRCECIAGYRPANENRRCEVTLSSQQYESSCGANQFNDAICENEFGKNAVFCSVGQCRCSGNQTFPNRANTHCYALLNQLLASPMGDCPPNSTLNGNRCLCNSGYRASSDSKECVRLQVQLVEYTGPSTNTSGALTREDCQALFTGPVLVYTTGRCQCINDSFINDKRDGCWYRLNTTSTQVNQREFCPPNAVVLAQPVCVCDIGYIAKNDRCIPISTRVYNSSDSSAPTIPGLTESDCVKVHGRAATTSVNKGHCICKPTAFPVDGNSFCNFLINETTSDIKVPEDCPANTIISPASPPSACVCKAGYYMAADSRTCKTSKIVLSGTANVSQSSSANCVNFTDTDCTSNFGQNAFCRNETCFCDRESSFINAAGQCESLSTVAFPGEHELHLYACLSDEDCQGKQNVVCDYLNSASKFKVCRCKDGALLDPKSQTCTLNRCDKTCDASLNFECNGYECVCKAGYLQSGNRCVQSSLKPQLYQACNQSATWQLAFATSNTTLQCNTKCERVECKPGYRPEKSTCVEAKVENTRCANQESICQQIDANFICNKLENECWCKPSYYESDNKCVASVGTACQTDEQCGNDMVCKGQRCDCNPRQRKQDTTDRYGRTMQRCVNGINHLQFSSILILVSILILKLSI